MTTPKLQVRRATIEDLPKLVPLWTLEKLPVADLEQRFKEFQVVEDEQGELIAALALQIAGPEGRVHSESFRQFDQAETLRPMLLERLKAMAANHGLVRLWTQLNSNFWRMTFQDATSESLAKLPPAFAAMTQPWYYLQLRAEATPVSLEKEFALFKEAEQESVQRVYRQARVARVVALVVVLIVFALIGVWAVLWFRAQRAPH